jgi:hypothetical protein
MWLQRDTDAVHARDVPMRDLARVPHLGPNALESTLALGEILRSSAMRRRKWLMPPR